MARLAHSRARFGFALSALLTLPHASFAQKGTTHGEWRHWGGDLGNTRYAPLEQITRDNVKNLEIAWRWKSDNLGPRPDWNLRATPIMVKGVLYTTAGFRRAAVAIDAATGETLWIYRLDEGERGRTAPRQTSGRGVSYWTDGKEERIFFLTPGYQMVALDAKTGHAIPNFGRDGIVDLKEDLDRKVDLVKDPIGSSSPAIVIGDVIVMGAAFPQGGAPPTKEMPAGHVRGYDVRTGKRLWIFHTVPVRGEFGYDTWEADSAEFTGNTGVWTMLAADEELGYVYLPVEDPTGDYYGGHRPGDNLFSSGIVCLNAKTGERVWHFQTAHHDIWDYDLPAAPILVDIEVDGKPIKAVAQLTKQAFTFVFDRATGKPVWPIEERPVPQSDVPGEKTSPTQPFPTKPPPFDLQGVTENDLIDFTPELKKEALEIAKTYRLGPLYTPPSVINKERGFKGTLMVPGAQGGANWPGGVFDPETGMLYVASTADHSVVGLVNDPKLSNMNFIQAPRNDIALPQGGGPQGLPLLRPPWGRITAIDLRKGEIVWSMANAEASDFVKNHPALRGVNLPRAGRPDRSGLLVTKTLLFSGEGAGLFATFGSGGNKFRAHDKLTGAVLWEMDLPANQAGMPMTYTVRGAQYIALAVGAIGHPAEIVAFRLKRQER